MRKGGVGWQPLVGACHGTVLKFHTVPYFVEKIKTNSHVLFYFSYCTGIGGGEVTVG